MNRVSVFANYNIPSIVSLEFSFNFSSDYFLCKKTTFDNLHSVHSSQDDVFPSIITIGSPLKEIGE